MDPYAYLFSQVNVVMTREFFYPIYAMYKLGIYPYTSNKQIGIDN
jgi:hypothetical protein